MSLKVTERDIQKAIEDVKGIFTHYRSPRAAILLSRHPGTVLAEVEKKVLEVLVNL